MLSRIYLCNVFNLILYLLNKFIYFVAIHAEIIQMYLFSLQCKFYCIYTLNGYFIHVFTYIIFTHELIYSSLCCTQMYRTDLLFCLPTKFIAQGHVMLCCDLPSPGEVRNEHSMSKVSFCTPVSCRWQAHIM